MKYKNPKDFVANYELNNYRYSDFWVGREYEHQAEVALLGTLLEKYVPDLKNREIVDLGGAYGRLAPLYADKVKRVILADYSTNELLEGTGRFVLSPFKDKVSFLALNAYKMPISSGGVDLLLSVRVMHHLKEIDLFWAELSRVLSPGGMAIIEFANKNHILSILRHIVRFNLYSYLKQKIIRVTPQLKSSQGLKVGQVSIMYNFDPSYIKEISVDLGFEVQGLFACSFLRSGFFKKLLPTEKLVEIERYLQRFFPRLLITPSVFIVLKKKGDFLEKETPLFERLICPTCNEKLDTEQDLLSCKNKHLFKQLKLGIVDLRDPRPEEVDF